MKSLLAYGAVVLLAGCANVAPLDAEKTAAEQAKAKGAEVKSGVSGQARIRLFATAKQPAYITTGMDCTAGKKGETTEVGGKSGDVYGAQTGVMKSQSLGITSTVTTRNLGARNGLRSETFFREFVIPAGLPVNIQAEILSLVKAGQGTHAILTLQGGACRANKGSFVPQAGKDYEVVGIEGAGCNVAVYEVDKAGAQMPVPVAGALSCPAK